MSELSPAPATETTTCFVVEGLIRGKVWDQWSISDGASGRSLNPCTTLEEARGIQGELDDFRQSAKTAYTDSRIVQVVTTVTRRIVT